jgi:xanthine dehydrogenase molybdopterin-binding subunit B
MNCTAEVKGDKVEIWAPTQNPEAGRQLVAKTLGVPPANVKVRMTRCGGGFGRRLSSDFMPPGQAAVEPPGRHPARRLSPRRVPLPEGRAGRLGQAGRHPRPLHHLRQ